MKTTTNKEELKLLNACEDGYKKFVKAHGSKDAKLSECVDSNGWDDVWWLISNTYSQFSEDQKHDLRVFGCNAALMNIEKIKPYCSSDEYKIITDYLNNPTESAARSAAMVSSMVSRVSSKVSSNGKIYARTKRVIFKVGNA